MARESISTEVSDLRRELSELNNLITKMVATNINVQSKVTESLIKMDDLIKEVKDMVELLQVATEMESGPTEIHGFSDMTSSLKKLNTNVESIDTNLKKVYRRLFVMSQSTPLSGVSQRKPVFPQSRPSLQSLPVKENKLPKKL
ncbi:MAG: hypothetical protein GON13_02860 [Nanoarchaeota archaeon]|nr:hypothetical protein [Nanoarchaeota archaeon]